MKERQKERKKERKKDRKKERKMAFALFGYCTNLPHSQVSLPDG
jgi:hypothetical protein